MKFSETMMYEILRIPYKEWNKGCLYVFVLKIPLMLAIIPAGVIMAIIFDCAIASYNVLK